MTTQEGSMRLITSGHWSQVQSEELGSLSLIHARKHSRIWNATPRLGSSRKRPCTVTGRINVITGPS
jgi:hypothetical protein